MGVVAELVVGCGWLVVGPDGRGAGGDGREASFLGSGTDMGNLVIWYFIRVFVRFGFCRDSGCSCLQFVERRVGVLLKF